MSKSKARTTERTGLSKSATYEQDIHGRIDVLGQASVQWKGVIW